MEADAYNIMLGLQVHHWWWRGFRRLYRAVLAQYLPRARRPRYVLDVGCGFGANLPVLDPVGEVIGLDLSLSALRRIPERSGLRLVQARADALPFRAAVFDVVAALAVIEHTHHDDEVLSETYRVTRPGGIQLILTSAFMFLWSHHDVANHHYRRYRASQLDRLQQTSGWHVLMTSYAITVVFPAVALIRLLQRAVSRRTRAHAPAYDMGSDWWPLNRLLELMLGFEGWLIVHHIRLPFGVDLVSVARRDS